MDFSQFLKKTTGWFGKYKYALLILVAGIALMLFPTGGSENKRDVHEFSQIQTEKTTEERLAEILSQVKGAGNVQVMLTTKEGELTLYQTNTSQSSSDGSQSSSSNTVLIADENRVQKGLVTQTYGPKYQGAIVLCHGAKDPSVQLAIIDDVSKVTGLGSDKISVLELK